MTSRFDAFRSKVKDSWEKELSIADLIASIEKFLELMLRELFSSITPGCTIYFVIDGINKCPTSAMSNVRSLLQQLLEFSGIRVFITSQPTRGVVESLRESEVVLIESHNHENINSYIDNGLHESPLLNKRFQAVNKISQQFFAEKHCGMFLWVSLMFDLLDAFSDGDFVDLLDEVPTTINDLYQTIVIRLVELHPKQKIFVVGDFYMDNDGQKSHKHSRA